MNRLVAQDIGQQRLLANPRHVVHPRLGRHGVHGGHHARHHLRHHQEAQVTLRLLERLGEGRDIHLDRGDQRTERQHDGQGAHQLGGSEHELDAQVLQRDVLEQGDQQAAGDQHAQHGGRGAGEPLAAGNRAARCRVHQQCLERAALTLTGGRVGGDRHRPREGRDHPEQWNEPENHRRALLRTRDLDVLDLHRRRHDRVDAAADQPEAANLVAIAQEQRPNPLHLGPVVLARAIGDQADLRRCRCGEVLREVIGNDDNHVFAAGADGFFRIGRTRNDRDARLLLQPLDERRCVGRANDRHRDVLHLSLATGEVGEHEADNGRGEQRTYQHRHD